MGNWELGIGNWELVAPDQYAKYKNLLYTLLKSRKNLHKPVEGKNVGYNTPAVSK
jgi:hypothetical protein